MLQKVEVTWVDAHSEEGWCFKEELTGCYGTLVCRSIGYLLEEEKDRIILVMSEDMASGRVASGLAIPRRSILSIHSLEYVEVPGEKEKRTTRKNKRISNT